MKIRGYSERGVVASLFYEMKCAEVGTELLDRFISLVEFPACFGKKKRKIGSNKTVRRAAEELSGYLDDSFYVLLVPDSGNNLREFFN